MFFSVSSSPSTAITVHLAQTLLHFIWQGSLWGGLALILARILANRTPSLRYASLLVVFVAMASSPLVTFGVIHSNGSRLDRSVSPSLMASPSIQGSKNPTSEKTPQAPTVASGENKLPSDTPAPSPDVTSVIPAPNPLLEVPPSSNLADSRRIGSIRYSLWLVSTWGIGVAILSLRLCLGFFGVARVRWFGIIPAPLHALEQTQKLCQALRISVPVRVCESSFVHVPLVIGWIRPLILLPLGMISGLDDMQLRGLLAHELGHIRRCDYLVNLLQVVLETLLFYHPVVWWISARLRHERELCCDDIALSLTGDRILYANLLSFLAERRTHWSLASAATGGHLLSRIRHVLAIPESRPQLLPYSGVIGIVILAISLTFLLSQTGNSLLNSNDRIARENSSRTPNAISSEIAPLGPDESALTGSVIDEATSQPVANIRVSAVGIDPANCYETLTDSQGKYRLLIKPDRYDLHTGKPGRACRPIHNVKPEAGQSLDVEPLRLVSPAYVSGRVTDKSTGNPVTKTWKGAPLTVAYSQSSNRRRRMDLGTAPVRDDGTYLLEVFPDSRPLVFLNDPDVEFEASQPWISNKIQQGEVALLNFGVVGPHKESEYTPTPSPLDELIHSENGTPLDVDLVLNELRKFYTSVRTGEFTCQEREVSVSTEGRRETIEATLRGVFDRDQHKIRHEYQRLTGQPAQRPMMTYRNLIKADLEKKGMSPEQVKKFLATQPVRPEEEEQDREISEYLSSMQAAVDRVRSESGEDVVALNPLSRVKMPKDIVLFTDELTAINSQGSLTIQDPSNKELLISPGRLPIDPMAMGLFSVIRSPYNDHIVCDFRQFEKNVENFRRSNDSEEETVVSKIRAYSANDLYILAFESIRKSPSVTVIMRIWIFVDPKLNFAPVRCQHDLRLDKADSPPVQKYQVDVSWVKSGDVYVPSVVEEFNYSLVELRKCSLHFDWKNVNQPISQEEFDPLKLNPGTRINDRRTVRKPTVPGERLK